MSSNFNFTTDCGDSSTTSSTDNSGFTFTTDSKPSPRSITVYLSDDEMQYLKDLAEQRNQSYANGETTDNSVGGNSSKDVHLTGLKGELAVSKVYGDGSVDESISATGDDGVDVTIEIGGEQRKVDVKANKYSASDAWIMLKKQNASGNADAYVSVYVEENAHEVVICGWATKDELIKQENVSESKYGWTNYKLELDEQRKLTRPDKNIREKEWCELR